MEQKSYYNEDYMITFLSGIFGLEMILGSEALHSLNVFQHYFSDCLNFTSSFVEEALKKSH